MEYFDIEFKGIPVEKINAFIKDELCINSDNVIRSHFFSDDAGDFEYSDTMDLSAYFLQPNTANIFAKQIKLNSYYNNVICVITSDGCCVDVDCDISETDFDKEKIAEIAGWIKIFCLRKIITNAKICSDIENVPIVDIGI